MPHETIIDRRSWRLLVFKLEWNGMSVSNSIEKNIDAVHSARLDLDEKRRLDQKLFMVVARFFATTGALYVHLIAFLIWGNYLIFEIHGDLSQAHLDVAGLILSGEAICLAIFVLINQRHTAVVERRNADLHLQMSLISEEKITQLARILDTISQELGVAREERNALKTAKIATRAEEILEHLEQVETSISSSEVD